MYIYIYIYICYNELFSCKSEIERYLGVPSIPAAFGVYFGWCALKPAGPAGVMSHLGANWPVKVVLWCHLVRAFRPGILSSLSVLI